MSTTRKTRSGVFSAGSSISKKKNCGNKVAPGEEEFLKMIELATYEINVDPYRGIRPLISQHNKLKNDASPNMPIELDALSGTKTTPIKSEDEEAMQKNKEVNIEENIGWWRSNCSMRSDLRNAPCTTDPQNSQISTDGSDSGEVISVADSIEERVQSIVGCTCPTLMKWMSCARQRKEARAGKRKRKRSINSNALESQYFGRRYSDDEDKECICDYNPFCLATLGGAMDDMLEQWVNERTVTAETQSSDMDTGDVIVLDDAIVLEESSSDSSDGAALEFYKPKTLELLKEVRKSTNVDETSIRSYLLKILPGLTDVLSIDEGIARIRHWQESLVFTNPVPSHDYSVKTTNTEVGHESRFSMPPGIENLGATCYLNTQLQCLAQNLVFVDGIMSWRPSTDGDDDRMTSVLALFQDLLLRMTSGPHSIVNTKEFSNALELDHFEQQDPNEFSRLFFDRMHMSFQEGDNNKNLADLLPRLFQGVIAYEITCLVCGTKSKRTEEFMDLNLPIVQRNSAALLVQKKVDSSQTKFDTDVQHCLNEYCSDEMLDGENQYHCTNCKDKCDAKRALSFQKLPPVLNVQLCRYVFNREKLIKTKLSDKVLLPLHLDVQSQNGSQCESSKNRFYLCAIMRHKGTSAYSGHYIAETMDWRSGQWFEFNDASVTHLKNGPSNCYDPITLDLQLEELRMTNHSKSNQLVGSTDAYNMYYVEESFLAHCILEKMRNQSDLRDETPVSTTLMSNERSKYFDELRQMCLDDERVANQLKKRRERLCVDVIPKLAVFDTTNLFNLVWIETSFLRQVLSCKELLTAQLEHPAILVSHHDLLCSHDPAALHPRIARGGKLIPKDVYDSLMIILHEEIHDTVGTNSPNRIVHDPPISLQNNLVCEHCIEAYRSELDGKVSFAIAVKNLFDDLDPKEMKYSRYLQPGETIEKGGDQYVYLVSRKFITWFRNKTLRFMKQANNAKSEKKLQLDLPMSTKYKSIAMGLDGLNIEEFWNLQESESFFGIIEACGIGEDEGISVRVNGPFTCRHGNYIVNTSANSFVFVPWFLWKSIKAMFPAAVEHKRRRMHYSQDIENSSDDDDEFFGCMLCSDEEASKNCYKRKLDYFAKHCQMSQTYKILPRDIEALNTLSVDDARFYLVSMDDFDTWSKVLTVLSPKGKGKGDQTFKQLVEAVLLNGVSGRKPRFSLVDASKDIASDDDHKILGLFSRFFRSTMCDDHGLTVSDALFQNVNQRDEPLKLRDNICIVPAEAYHQYLSHISAACIVLCQSESESVWKELTLDEMMSQGRNFLSRIKCTMHNYCVFALDETQESSTDRFFVNCKLFQLTEPSCRNAACRQAYKTMEAPESSRTDVSGNTECISVIDDPIDMDTEVKSGLTTPPTVSLIVLDVKADAELGSVLNMLESVDGFSNRDEQDVDQFSLRRSSRKRTSRYCCSDVLSEETIEMRIDNNVAALRLALMERCTKGTEFELNHILTLVFLMQFKADNKVALDENNKATDMEPLFKMIDLPFSSNTKTIRDICEEGFGGPYDLSISTFIIRQASVEPSTENIAHDQLLDTLLSLANTPTDIKADGAKPKKSRTEKGFSGTFLSLATVPKVAAIPSELNDAVALPTTTLSHQKCDKGVTIDLEKETDMNAIVTDSPTKSEPMKRDMVDVQVPLNDEADKLAAVDSKIRRLSSTSNQYSESKKVCEPVTADEGAPELQVTAKQTYSDIEHDKSISIDDDNSDDDVELLRSPFKRKSASISPSKRGAAKSIQLSLSSVGVQYTSKNKKQTDAGSRNGRTHLQYHSSDGPDSRLISEIVRRLLMNPDINRQNHEDICHMAAENAIEMHPHLDEALDLVDAAYAVYLELTLPP